MGLQCGRGGSHVQDFETEEVVIDDEREIGACG